MSAKNDIIQLRNQADVLYQLVVDTNRILNVPNPVSCVGLRYQQEVSELAPKLVNTAQKMINRGKIEEAIVGAAVLAGGWVVAKSVDSLRNGKAKRDAAKALMGYYQELVSKQSMIIAEQEKLQKLMAEYVDKLQDNEEYYREQLRILQRRQAELTDLLRRFEELKGQM